MLKKVASTKLLSGLFVAGGILGMNQAAKAGNVVNSEVILVIPGRMQIAYGDLKARIDMVRNKTESLIVGAYMEESGIDYTVLAGKATNSVGKNVFASKPLQADAAFLVDATVVAAGGYHMSIAALNVFQSCLLPNSIP